MNARRKLGEDSPEWKELERKFNEAKAERKGEKVEDKPTEKTED